MRLLYYSVTHALPVGVNDKTLAEFVIALHDESKTLPEFKQKLGDVGADFPDSFVENMDRLILNMHPKHKKKLNELPKTKSGKERPGEISEKEKKARIFPGLTLPDQEWKPTNEFDGKDATALEVDDLMSQLENVGNRRARGRPTAGDFMEDSSERSPKRRRPNSPSPPRHSNRRRSPSPPRARNGNDDAQRGRKNNASSRSRLDERPVLYKIYNGKVSSIKDFGAFIQLEGVVGRAEGVFPKLPVSTLLDACTSTGLCHVSAIRAGGGRVGSASELLTRGQAVKVKVMSAAGSRLSLSIRDVDQVTGEDLSPHLRIKSEAEMLEEQRLHATRTSTGSNSTPLGGGISTVVGDDRIRSAKRLTSPERWEIKQLIASGAVDASEYPNLDEDFASPVARAEVEEELDVEVREDEPSFLAGQTRQTLDMSPVKIVKAPDGSLNRAALAGASLAKERRELRQQDANDQADAEARDFNAPWLDPMAQGQDKIFAQDLRGNILGQKASEVPQWKQETFNKATTFGRITSLSIGDQRKSLPIYKLREPLLDAIREVCILQHQWLALVLMICPSIKFSS